MVVGDADGHYQGVSGVQRHWVLRPHGHVHLHIALLVPQVHGGGEGRGPHRDGIVVGKERKLCICQLQRNVGFVADLQVQLLEQETTVLPLFPQLPFIHS